MTAEERSSLDNGIWLCASHAKAIDDDEVRFDHELLRGWRHLAEQRAHEALMTGSRDLLSRDLVRHQIRMLRADGSGLLAPIVSFSEDIGLNVAWGRKCSLLVTRVVYELALNAFQHGDAETVVLSSGPEGICVVDASEPFGVGDLLRTDGGGGRAAVAALMSEESGSIEVVHAARDGLNQWTLMDVEGLGGLAELPCTVSLAALRSPREWQSLPRLAGCDVIHVYAPIVWTFSDSRMVAERVKQELGDRRVIFHGIDEDDPIAAFVRRYLPDVEFRPRT